MCGRITNPPCFNPCGLKIKEDGRVLALAKKNPGDPWAVECVYLAVEDMVSAFRSMADILQDRASNLPFDPITDADREDMFNELRMFVFNDERARKDANIK